MMDVLRRRPKHPAPGEGIPSLQAEHLKSKKRTKNHYWGYLLLCTGILVLLAAGIGGEGTTQQVDTGGSLRSKPGTVYIDGLKGQQSQAETQPGICINNLADMPEHWQPLDNLYKDSGKPWSRNEQALADEAVEKGLDELVKFYKHNMTMSRLKALKRDAVNSLIDEAYASANRPAYHRKALRAAAQVLQISAKQFLLREDAEASCTEMYDQLKYVGYGQYLVSNLPDDEALQNFHLKLVTSVNAMIQACGSLRNLLDLDDVHSIFQAEHAHADDVFDWVLTAIALTDCLTVPDLALPEGTEEFISNVWNYLARYKWPYARDHAKHYGDHTTRNTAWLATHVANVPSGYGRHQQLIEDAPYLYKYIRENFYYALEDGMLDLFCEFVDLVRQYGCTEDNDYQVRHGTRYILSLYKKAGHSWMNYREEGQEGKKIGDYGLIHKPWTAISGVIRREFEPIVPGSYGYAFQQALAKAQAKDVSHTSSKNKQRHQ